MDANVKNPALAIALAGIGLVETKAPKAKAGKVVEIKRRDMTLAQVDAADQDALDAKFSATRQEALETLAALAEDLRYSVETKRAAIAECVAIMYPAKRATWEAHKAAGNFLKTRSEYAYKEYIRALKAYLGKLPTASGKGGKKSAGIRPKVWMRGLDSDVQALADRIAKMPARDIDQRVAKDFVAAYKALVTMVKVVRKAVND